MTDFKKCIDCETEKPIDQFPVCNKKADRIYRLRFCGKCNWLRRKSRPNPSNYYYASNKEAWNAYQREWARKRREEKKTIKNKTNYEL